MANMAKQPRIWLCVALFMLTLSLSFTAAHSQQTACQFHVASTRDLGTVTAPVSVTARDGGATGLIGNKILWTFGDTLFTPRSTDGTNLRSSTAALGTLNAPLNVSEPLDANGAPFPLLAFTPEEQQYNDSHAKDNERIALWPVSVIPDTDQSGIIFYLRLKVKPGTLNYEFIGTGIAEIGSGKTTAIRDPGLLFTTPDPMFASAFIGGSDLYLYGKLDDWTKNQSFGVARVPLNMVHTRSAYKFWNGDDWVRDVKQSAGVLSNIPGDVSVSYNIYLRRYLAVHSEAMSNRILMQTAEQPQGEWSDPVAAFSGRQPVDGIDYAGRQHPELASTDGRIVVISYYHPLGGFRGELRLVEVTLDTTC